MKRVSFFRSIHLKFVLIYMFLILIAMQIIGVYFVKELENQLVNNFSSSLRDRVSLLVYNLEQEYSAMNAQKTQTTGPNISTLLRDFSSDKSTEVRVIDKNSRVMATSNQDNQELVGKKMTNLMVNRVITSSILSEKIELDAENGHRVQLIVAPIKSNNDLYGVVYVEASMEEIYEQMQEINKILLTGTGLALLVTGILGILLAQTITRPISEMRRLAVEMAKGNFSKKVKVYGYDEIGQLSLAFNNLSKKLLEARASTEGEKRKLGSVISHMTDGVIATDRKGRIILINEPACDMLNVSRETALEKSIMSILDTKHEKSLEKMVEDQEDLILDFSTEKKQYIIKVSFTPILKDTGRFNGLIIVLYDITEQEIIEQERRDFVANVSHELRTPLTTMRSYLEALTDGAWTDKEIAPRFLDVAQTETERMIRLVNDLLALSKMDATDYRITREWVEFTDFFNRIIDRFEMTKSTNVQFIRAFSDKERLMKIDEDKITQVLDNIISNALKYSPEGGIITYRLKQEGNFLKISVSDQGVGIPKQNVTKIFDRFYRVDRARSRKLGGTGLGLAIAKEMIQVHGGQIWAQSIEGKGTTIHFILPIDEYKEDDWG